KKISSGPNVSALLLDPIGDRPVGGRQGEVPASDCDILSRRDNCHCPIRAPILERPVLDIQNPTTSGIDRWSDRSIGNRDDTLSSSKLAGCPESDVPARCSPLKNDDSLEARITRVAAIDLELV